MEAEVVLVGEVVVVLSAGWPASRAAVPRVGDVVFKAFYGFFAVVVKGA